MNNFVVLIVQIILRIILLNRTLAAINGVEYFIKSYGDNLCLTAGKAIENDPGTLYVHGEMATQPCRDPDFHQQQWITTYDEGSNTAFKITSGAVAHYYRNDLNANLTGDFVKYFPNAVKIMEVKGSTNLIEDEKTKQCYTSQGENRTIGKEECNQDRKSQLWIFVIVQERSAPGTNCSSFWVCNH